ncbi:MAG: hypothetical protein WCF90_06060 [Methanomicrobiales archaeon]
MPRLGTILKWLVILIPFVIIGILTFTVIAGRGMPAHEPSGFSGNGRFFEVPLSTLQQYTDFEGNWKFTLTSRYVCTLIGIVVGRHEYSATRPDGIIPLDLAVVNWDLIKTDLLSYFKFTMGSHTLQYSYEIPTFTGFTEQNIDEYISNSLLVFLNKTLENEVKRVQVGDCLIIKKICGRLGRINGCPVLYRYEHGEKRGVSCRVRDNSRSVLSFGQLRDITHSVLQKAGEKC